MSTDRAPRPDLLAGGSEVGRLRARFGARGPHPWWWRVSGLLAFAAVAALVGPDLLAGRAAPEPEEDSTPRTRGTVSAFPLDWPARGNISADTAFVTRAVERLADDRPRPRLLLAQRLPDGSRLVMASTSGDGDIKAVTVHVLFAPVGATVASGRESLLTTFFDPGELVAWAGRSANGHVQAVVLGRPGPLRVSLSPRVEFSGNGIATRDWISGFSEQGLIVTDLGTRTEPTIAVRPEPVFRFPSPFPVRVDEGSDAGGQPPAVGGAYASFYRGPDPDVLSRAVAETVGRVVDVSDAQLRVVWSGTQWQGRRLALVGVRRGDGAAFQSLVGQYGDRWYSRGVHAVPPDEVDTMPWLLAPSSPAESTLLICPTGRGSLVYRRAGREPMVLPINDQGFVALVPPGPSPPSVAGARVTVRSADGRAVVTTTLRTPWTEHILALD